MEDDHGVEGFPVSQALDNVILMHRDAHFGGDFAVMLDYYAQEGKGTLPDIDIRRIQELALLEKQMQQNLAGLLLSGTEAEQVAEAKEMYLKLREVYEKKDRLAQLIADLILTEDLEPEAEIQALVAERNVIVPSLIQILRSEQFYDPLFPGYGKAPSLAAQTLGLIGDKRAIIALFEALGSGDFFDEEMIYTALHAIGEPAKEFLLKVVHGRPLNDDNEKAAVALIQFKHYPEVASFCFKMLFEPDVLKHIPLATYLVLVCEGLTDPNDRETFKSLGQAEAVPRMLKQDIKAVCHAWEEEAK